MNANNNLNARIRIRIRIITIFFVLTYLIILGTAFYYQVIGDKAIKIYQSHKNYFELILIEIMKVNIDKIWVKILILIMVFCILISGKNLIKHVLTLKKDKSLANE